MCIRDSHHADRPDAHMRETELGWLKSAPPPREAGEDGRAKDNELDWLQEDIDRRREDEPDRDRDR